MEMAKEEAGVYVSPKKYNTFTIKATKEILEWATKEFQVRFNEDIDFNFVSLKMGDTKGKYWKDKNKLLIYKMDPQFLRTIMVLFAVILLL